MVGSDRSVGQSVNGVDLKGGSDVVSALHEALGDAVLVRPIDARYHGDWSGVGHTEPLAVVRPSSTAEVSRAVKICHAFGQAVVPQGGLSGLAGGATPRDGDVVLSMERMRGVEVVDPVGGTITVLAGTTLEAANAAALAIGLELGYDIGSRGSAQIGGTIATNAGGNRVIRFGMAREQVLGLEVVLADGTIVSTMNTMLKNNTGYDIRQLFIGSEGTLGIITRAVLRLHPVFRSRLTALCAAPSYDAIVQLLALVRSHTSGLTAFEIMWGELYDFMARGIGGSHPLEPGRPIYALVELSGDDREHDERRLEQILADATDRALVTDAVVAASERETRVFWRYREAELIDALPSIINFDVSIPIAHLGACAVACETALRTEWPEAHVFLYGHIGDSNLHLSTSVGSADQGLLHRVDRVVYDVVRTFGGSISAEHGIGTLKRDFLHYSRSETELDVMRRIKAALDPTGILNPGKVL